MAWYWPFGKKEKGQDISGVAAQMAAEADKEQTAIRAITSSAPAMEKLATKMIIEHTGEMREIFPQIQEFNTRLTMMAKRFRTMSAKIYSPTAMKTMKGQAIGGLKSSATAIEQSMREMEGDLQALETKKKQAADLLKNLKKAGAALERDINATTNFLGGFESYLSAQRERIKFLESQARMARQRLDEHTEGEQTLEERAPWFKKESA